METFFPSLMPEMSVQAALIHRMALKMNVSDDTASPHWVDQFALPFREAWESGVHDIEGIENRIYKRDPLGSNWADSVAAILIGVRDPRLTQ